MPGAALLAATVAAVLCPHEVVFVDVAGPTVVRKVTLPSEGLAVFAAPDGRILVPLGGEDATAVIAASGGTERWAGRVFPLFFDEYDRMQVVMPGVLATLSYPERVPLQRHPLPGLTGARRAASSLDGRIVAVIPAEAGTHALILVAAMEFGTPQAVALPGDASHVVIANDGGFAVAAIGGATPLVVVLGGGQVRGALPISGEVRCLCLAPGGTDVLVGLGTGATGEVLALKVDPPAKVPLKEHFRTPLPAPVLALAAAGEEVVAVGGEALLVLAKGGRRVRGQVGIVGARDVAVLPSEAKTTVPTWSDKP